MAKKITKTTSTEEITTPATTADAQSKPKFNANAARKHKLTSSLLRLEKRSDGWVAVCETHSTESAPQTTRDAAERLRVAGTFCPKCQQALSERAAAQVTKSENASPAEGDASQQVSEQPKPKRQPRGAKNERQA